MRGRILIVLVALGSLALLLARSRPLQRFTGGAEALLYATGLDAPRALHSLSDGTILAAERTGSAVRVVELQVDGAIMPRTDAWPALQLPDTGTLEGVVTFPRVGTAWSVTGAPDGALIAALAAQQPCRARGRWRRDLRRWRRASSAPAGAIRCPPPRPSRRRGVVRRALRHRPQKDTSGQVVRVFSGRALGAGLRRLDLAGRHGVAPSGQLYVLELARSIDPQTGIATPSTGRLLAIGPAPHQRRTIARQIDLPSGLAITPAGDAYFTERAFPSGQSAPGGAHLLRLPAGGLEPGA